MVGVDTRQAAELIMGEAWLRRVEPAPAGLVAEPPEHGRDRLHVPVSERADDDRGAVRKVEGAGLHG